MSPIDLHPEDLLDRDAHGTLTDRDREVLEGHCQRCAACSLERDLRANFAEELTAQSEDDEILTRVIERVVPAQKPGRRRRRSPMLAWIAAAAAVLFSAGAAGAVWTVYSTLIAPQDPPGSELNERNERDEQTSEGVSARALDTGRPNRRVSDELSEIDEPDEPLDPELMNPTPAKTDRARTEPQEDRTEHTSSNEVALPTAEELFARANQARRAQRYGEAVQFYRELGRRFPGSRQEVASRVSLGRLLLDRLGNSRRALQLFESYLLATPSGNLSQEARLGQALSHQRLGQRSAESRAWRSLLDHHPNSVHAARARTRLEALGHAPSPSGSTTTPEETQ